MATGPGVNQGKSAFLKEFLPDNPDANEESVNKAWKAAGHEGTISGSLVNKLRSDLDLTGSRGRKGGASGQAKSAGAKGQGKASKGKGGGQAAGRGRPQGGGRESATSAPANGSLGSKDRERALDRVEDGIDDLIGELKQLGGLDEALEALRRVRRVVVRSHGG
jgi:hypothetical protein